MAATTSAGVAQKISFKVRRATQAIKLSIALLNLSLRPRKRLDHIPGLHIPVSAFLGNHLLRRQLELHYKITVFWPVSHLMSARKTLRVPGTIQYTANKPFHGLRVTRCKSRLACLDVSVLCGYFRPLLGDHALMFGSRRRQSPQPLFLILAMLQLARLRTVPGPPPFHAHTELIRQATGQGPSARGAHIQPTLVGAREVPKDPGSNLGMPGETFSCWKVNGGRDRESVSNPSRTMTCRSRSAVLSSAVRC